MQGSLLRENERVLDVRSCKDVKIENSDGTLVSELPKCYVVITQEASQAAGSNYVVTVHEAELVIHQHLEYVTVQ